MTKRQTKKAYQKIAKRAKKMFSWSRRTKPALAA
jgi:hypothetical protein